MLKLSTFYDNGQLIGLSSDMYLKDVSLILISQVQSDIRSDISVAVFH